MGARVVGFDPGPILRLQGKRSDTAYAKELGVQRKYLGEWRQGRRMAPFMAERLALILGRHPDELWKPWPAPDVVPGWEQRARCTPDLASSFFGETAADTEFAKGICAACPVIRSCGEFALAHRIGHGVWGGMAPKDRRKIIKLRQLALQEAS